jgi:hypothetical protein
MSICCTARSDVPEQSQCGQSQHTRRNWSRAGIRAGEGADREGRSSKHTAAHKGVRQTRRLTRLAAERAGLKLVQLEGLGRTLECRHSFTDEPGSSQPHQRGERRRRELRGSGMVGMHGNPPDRTGAGSQQPVDTRRCDQSQCIAMQTPQRGPHAYSLR